MSRQVWLAVVLSLWCAITICADANTTPSPGTFAHFNAIGAVLRTQASIRQPNGMTVLPAKISANSIVYHGTPQKEAVRGFEWVAFEPDFAYWFALPRPRMPKSPPSSATSQHVFAQRTSLTNGYLHTYETTQDLNLLLLDGLSAFKRTSGTQDMQDLLLLNQSTPCVPSEDRSNNCEYHRAEGLCSLARERWQGNLHGFIRKDPEWEMIICSFDQHLRLRDVMRVARDLQSPPMPFPPHEPRKGPWETIDLPNQHRDDTVIQSMVQVDFERGVSMFDVDQTLGSQSLPRLLNLTFENRQSFMYQLDNALSLPPTNALTNNVQRKVDMLVTRYGPILEQARSGNFSSLEQVNAALGDVLKFYKGADEDDTGAVSKRCAMPYAANLNASRPAHVVHEVAEYVCQNLSEIHRSSHLSGALHGLRSMIEKLRWLAWPDILQKP